MTTEIVIAVLALLVLFMIFVIAFAEYFGARSARYTLISPSDSAAAISPPPMAPDSDSDHGTDQRDQVGLQSFLAQRRFWNDEMNVLILRAASATTYNGNFTCLASGLHVSNFPLDHGATVDRLQQILDGSLPRSSVLAAPWRGVEMRTLEGVLRVPECACISWTRAQSLPMLCQWRRAVCGGDQLQCARVRSVCQPVQLRNRWSTAP